jgi:hypothetical protein
MGGIMGLANVGEKPHNLACIRKTTDDPIKLRQCNSWLQAQEFDACDEARSSGGITRYEYAGTCREQW